jgi:hypothetical protein
MAIRTAESNRRVVWPDSVVVAHLATEAAKVGRKSVLVPGLKITVAREVGLVEAGGSFSSKLS